MESKSSVSAFRDDVVVPEPPHNSEAEQALIGAIFINRRAYDAVSGFLRPEHFYNQIHARIYEAIGKLIGRGQEPSPIALKNLFDQDGALAEIGGALYLARLAEAAVTIINAEHYGRTILDLHMRREMIALAQDMIEQAHTIDIDVPAVKIAQEVDQALSGIVEANTPRRRGATFAEAVRQAVADTERAYKSEGKSAGLSTGLIEVDRALGGMAPGDLIVLAGASGQGKTGLLVQIADFLARRGEPVGICELEQTAPQLAQRILAYEADISVQKQRRGELDAIFEWPRYVQAAERIAGLPIYIDDTPAVGLTEIRRQARRWCTRNGIKLLAIDHLQLMRGERREGRRLEIDDFADGLKSLAKELEIPILLLSQLNRALAGRDNKRPVLSDLRESGSIEASADVVLFIFREEYYLAQNEPTIRDGEADDKFNSRYDRWQQQLERAAGVADVILAKNRHGATKTVRTVWRADLMRLDNLAWTDRAAEY